MRSPSYVAQIDKAIFNGQITFEQCQAIAQGLQCVDHGDIHPGAQPLAITTVSIDMSPCNRAIAQAGEDLITSNFSMIVDHFPNRAKAKLPIWCVNCSVFAPALKQLKALLPK